MRNLARASWRAGIDTAGWIHLNAAGASPSPALVHDAIARHLDLERTVGGYAAAARVERDPHAAVAALLNCAADEIALAESAQAGWARAFYSLAFRPNDRILTWESEYAGNAVAMLQVAERTGAQLEVLPMRADGVADVEALERALSATPPGASTLVALTHVQTESSVVQPAERVGAACRAAGGDTLYMLDACQTAGILPLDVEALGCDFLAATGRKWLRGPRGTGFLYARRGALAPGGACGDIAGATSTTPSIEPVSDVLRDAWSSAGGATCGGNVSLDSAASRRAADRIPCARGDATDDEPGMTS